MSWHEKPMLDWIGRQAGNIVDFLGSVFTTAKVVADRSLSPHQIWLSKYHFLIGPCHAGEFMGIVLWKTQNDHLRSSVSVSMKSH